MALDKVAAIAQIDPLLEAASRGTTQPREAYIKPYFGAGETASRALITRMVATVERWAPTGSPYRNQIVQVQEEVPHDSSRVLVLAGVLKALRDDIEAGYLRTVEEIVHADVFGDFLEMADELLAKKYKDPAAVIAGSVLEEHLRKLAIASGVEVESEDGRPRKADTINADLVKADAYNKLEQKSVTAWLGLRNSAAHGQYDDYDAAQVATMIQSVRDFMVRHPA